jgi:chemotaxis methyl-accepting protein methylase
MIPSKILLNRPKLSFEDFVRVSEYITNTFGVKLPTEKHVLVGSRLIKRLSQLGIEDFKEYTKLLF